MFIASSHKWHEFWAVKGDVNFQTFRKRVCFLVICLSPRCASWEKHCRLQTSTIRNCRVLAIWDCFPVYVPGGHIRGLDLGRSSAVRGWNNLVEKQRKIYLHCVCIFFWKFLPSRDLRLWVLLTESPLVIEREGDMGSGSPGALQGHREDPFTKGGRPPHGWTASTQWIRDTWFSHFSQSFLGLPCYFSF